MVYENQLVCYYSDQRDPRYGQKLVHQVTTTLETWGPVVNDVFYSNATYRPGMPIISQLPDNNYFMTYEFYGAVESTPNPFLTVVTSSFEAWNVNGWFRK